MANLTQLLTYCFSGNPTTVREKSRQNRLQNRPNYHSTKVSCSKPSHFSTGMSTQFKEKISLKPYQKQKNQSY